MNEWIRFSIVILSQFLFLLVVMWRQNSWSDVRLSTIVKIALLGMCFGIAFDYVVGSSLGVFTYDLGFGPFFLIVNGILSYGLWTYTIFVLRRTPLLPLYVWVATLAAVYELVNYFFPVWHWHFLDAHFFAQEAIVILAAYAGLSWITILVLKSFEIISGNLRSR